MGGVHYVTSMMKKLIEKKLSNSLKKNFVQKGLQ
jgi:hypothetical protein